MRGRSTESVLGWVSLTFAVVLAILCVVLLVTGGANGGLWFTVVAMVILATTSIIRLVSVHRRTQRND
ncbi:hypothetical protein [Microbacterium sp. NPDC089695]|uniref:hypothetical protein n=1 Tax=Microbacterium sp. NPDC089695 TaxID=3364198 RepID=UPI00381A8E89